MLSPGSMRTPSTPIDESARYIGVTAAHIVFAVAATIARAVLSAGWAGALAAGLQPSERLRDV